MEKHIGKTIKHVETDHYLGWLTILFTDGTEVTIYARGTQWLEVQ